MFKIVGLTSTAEAICHFEGLNIRILYLCHQGTVVHFLIGLHDSDNGCLDLMLPAFIYFLPHFLPFKIGFVLFGSN